MARLGAELSWPAQRPHREAPKHGEFGSGTPTKLQTGICREEAEMLMPGGPAKLPEPGAHHQEPAAQGQGAECLSAPEPVYSTSEGEPTVRSNPEDSGC